MPTLYYISSNKYSLQERMTKRGKVYDVRFRVVTLDGHEQPKKLCGYHTKALAKEAYLQFITENCELVKRNPLKKKKDIDNGKIEPIIKDLIPVYLSSLQNQNKESGIVNKVTVFNSHLTPYFGEMKLRSLTTEILYQWQDTLWGAKNPKTNDFYAYNYLSKIRTILNAFLNWCESRYGFANPMRQIKKPKRLAPKQEMSIWTQDEFKQFISVVDNERYKAIFTMLFYTGRRKGEVLALQKTDIKPGNIVFSKTYTRKTLDGASYKITSTKNQKLGKTPICKPLQAMIDSYKFESPFAFGGSDPLHENTVAHAFDRYIEKANVKRIRMHDLRHSFVSMLVHLGANLTVVADLIGDTLEQVTKTYAHLYEEDKQRIISRIE